MEPDEYHRAQKEGRFLAIWGIAGQFAALFVVFLLWVVNDVYNAYLNHYGISGQMGYSTVHQALAVAFLLSALVYIFGWGFLYKALFKKKYRAPWLFWMTLVACLFTAIIHAITMLLGILLVLWMIDHRREFFGPAPAE